MALIIVDNCSGLVQVVQEPEVFFGDYENYISKILGYKVDDITWISIDSINFLGEDISISDLQKGLKSLKNLNKIEYKINQKFEEFDEYFKLEYKESDSILEYGENEFFGGKKEAYEDMLEFIKNFKD